MNIRNYRRRPKLAPKGSRQQDTPRLQPCRDEGRGVAASRPSSSQAPRDIEPKPCRALVNRGTPRLQTERGQILVPQRFTHSCFFIPGPIFAPLSPPPACTRGCRLPRRFLPARRLRIRAAEKQHCSGGKKCPRALQRGHQILGSEPCSPPGLCPSLELGNRRRCSARRRQRG